MEIGNIFAVYFEKIAATARLVNETCAITLGPPQCPPPPLLSAGGPEIFSMFAKRGGLALLNL